jgi:hypothetical protein
MSNAPSGFDPNQFLDATQDTPNVKRPPLPEKNPTREDGLYIGVIGEVKMDAGTIGKGDRIGQPWLSAIIQIAVEVPQQVQDQMGLKLEKGTITLTDRAMIDLTPQNTIDNSVGRNRRQRQYRDALDLNKPGDVWSWRKASGQPIGLTVEHELYQGERQERIGLIVKRPS